MTRDEAVALLDRRLDAFGRADAAGLAATYTEDAVMVSPMFGTVTGRAAIQASHHKLFQVFKDMVIKPDPLIFEADRGAQSWVGNATHTSEIFGVPPTGRPFEIRGAFVYDFRDGLIAVERRLYDFTGLMLQLGVLKAKPQ